MLAKITVADYMTTHLAKLTKEMTGIDAIKKYWIIKLQVHQFLMSMVK